VIEVDCAFPGGNVLVDGVEGDTVRLRPDLRDTEGEWFYWHFRVRGAGGRRMRFAFHDAVVGVRGPAVSLDAGRTWAWLGDDAEGGRAFIYAFAAQAEVRFSVGMPYTQANLDAFLAAHADHPHLRADTLCRTRKGRPVACLSLGQLEEQPEHRVLVACRHHACEMMASYVLEGLMEAVLAEDETGRGLRESVEFLVAPFVDTDGVEDGDQGKNRRPHDHNRDYGVLCVYPEVWALRERVRGWSGDRLRIALDLHCPTLRGERDQEVYFVGGPNQEAWRRTEQFAAALEQARQGPIPFRSGGGMPFGAEWNTEAGDRHFGRWAEGQPGVWFGGTLEIPYASAGGVAVTAATARALGRDLAEALRADLAAGPG